MATVLGSFMWARTFAVGARLGVGFMALAIAVPETVIAQQAGPALELPPVTVTARKRDESEQTVPISMTVLEGSRLDVAPTASNAGLARSAPNVNFVDLGGQSSNLFTIRGVGSFSPISADDTSTVLYVNEPPGLASGVAISGASLAAWLAGVVAFGRKRRFTTETRRSTEVAQREWGSEPSARSRTGRDTPGARRRGAGSVGTS